MPNVANDTRDDIARDVIGRGSGNGLLSSILKSIWEPMLDLGVLPIPRTPNGLDSKYWGKILDVPTPQPVMLSPNIIQSKVGTGDRRMVTGGVGPHIEGGNYLDMSVAADVHVISTVGQLTYPFTIASVCNPLTSAIQVPASVTQVGAVSWSGVEKGADEQLFVSRVDLSGSSLVATGLFMSLGRHALIVVTFVSATEVAVSLDGKVVRLTAIASKSLEASDSLLIGKAKTTDAASDWVGNLSASFYWNAGLTDDEHFNLYETLMHNKGGPLVIPQVENLVRGYLLNERSGSICFDIANPLSVQTAAEIQNYTPTVRARSADLPKQSLNDQSCSESWTGDGIGGFDTPAVAADHQVVSMEAEFVESARSFHHVIAGSYSLGPTRRFEIAVSSSNQLRSSVGESATILGPVLSPGQYVKARINVNQATQEESLDWDVGDGWVIGVPTTYVGTISDLPIRLCANSFEGTTESAGGATVTRWTVTDNGAVIYDTKADGFGMPIGNPELILLPNQVKQPDIDIAGNVPDFIGSAPRDIRVEGNYQLTWDGSAQSLTVPELTGAETVVSSNGTSTPTVEAGSIKFTAGTCNNVLLDNGSLYVMSEGQGTLVNDAGPLAQHGTIAGFQANQWIKTGGVARNASEGFSFARVFDATVGKVVNLGQAYFSGKGDFYCELVVVNDSDALRFPIGERSGGGSEPFYIQVDAASCWLYLNGSISATKSIPPNTPVKIIASRVGDKVTFSVGDDVSVYTFADVLQTSPNNTTIGGLNSGSQAFDGVVREVKFGNVLGSMGYYKLNESFRGVVAIDSAGVSDGTYENFNQNETDIVRIPARVGT